MKLNFFFQALLVFSRDTSILEHFEHSSATPPKSYIRGNLFVERRFLGEKLTGLILLEFVLVSSNMKPQKVFLLPYDRMLEDRFAITTILV